VEDIPHPAVPPSMISLRFPALPARRQDARLLIVKEAYGSPKQRPPAFALRLALLQWVLLELDPLYAVPGSGIPTSSLDESEFFDPPAMQQSG
jgi:hypothetical protein